MDAAAPRRVCEFRIGNTQLPYHAFDTVNETSHHRDVRNIDVTYIFRGRVGHAAREPRLIRIKIHIRTLGHRGDRHHTAPLSDFYDQRKTNACRNIS
jgi:hypothetical protein